MNCIISRRKTAANPKGILLRLAAVAAIAGNCALAGEPLARQESITFLQILSFGIEINVTLVALFFIASFLFLYNLLITRRRKVMPLDLLRQVQDYVAAGNMERAISAFSSPFSPARSRCGTASAGRFI